ncbi:MAG TPA: aspartate dehydrogenase [Micropepsaceae bacterium]|jgi:aspartate dehydrogenase|nr:aspartate dehydrogenase [Micropepsaceae bacterium]
MTETVKVGIAGLGAIGRAVARKLHQGAIPKMELVGVAVRDTAKAQGFLKEIGCKAPILSIAQLAATSDIVIECAPAAVLAEIAAPVLAAGKKMMVLSAGMLLRHPELLAAAKEHGGQIIVPTGALLGFDAVSAAAEGDIRSVTMITRKPVTGLMGAPYLVKNNIAIDGITEAKRVFQGSAREAALGFPENVNVAAALSLAGIGPDRTTIEIWADPNVQRNMHRVVVEADSARFEMAIENVPSENPKTGRITALSALAALRKMTAPLRVGT